VSAQEAAESLPQKVLSYVGIDWAADTHAVCVTGANGRISAQFMNGHGQLPVAVGTSAAGGDHAVPHGEPAHRLADLGDRPDTVVPEDPAVGHRGDVALEDGQVGAADRAGGHRHGHIRRDFLPRIVARSVIDERLHQMTSVSSRADAGTGRASRGMARTHSAILAGLGGPAEPSAAQPHSTSDPGPRSPRLDGGTRANIVWSTTSPHRTGAPRTDYLWIWVQVAGCPRVRAARCTCRPGPRQGCCASLARWPATALDPGTSAAPGQGVTGQAAARRGGQPAWSTRSSRPALTHASTRDGTGPALSTNALFPPRGG